MSFIKDSLFTFLIRIAGVLLSLVVTIAIARALGPEGKGAYSLITLAPAILILVGDAGIGVSNTYFGGSKKYSWNQLVSNSLVSALILGILLTAAFLAYYFLTHPSFLKGAAPELVVLASFTVPLGLLSTYFGCVLLGQKRINVYNIINLSASIIHVVFTVAALLVFHWGMLGVIAVYVATSLVGALMPLYMVNRTVPIRWGFFPGVFKESAKFGLQVYLTNVVQFLNYRLDMFLVTFFLNATFVGYYSVSVNLAEALWYLPGAVATIIVARTPGMNTNELNKSTPQVCRNTFFITLICAIVLAVLAKPIIGLLYGAAFGAAVTPLYWLLPGIVSLSIFKVLANELAMRGKPILNAVAVIVSLVVNALLNIILIPRMGISGAALASTVSYTITTIIVLIFFLRMSKNNLFDTIVIKPQDLRMYLNVLKQGMTPSFWRR